MEINSCRLAELTANLKITDINAFNHYLKEVWLDLVGRATKNENDKINKNKRQDLIGLTKLIFSKYYFLPGIIGDRLFRVFDIKGNDILEFPEFQKNMNILFCDNYERNLRFIFDFYDFDGDGKISKEDIRVVLSYITFSDKDIIENEKSLNINNNLNNKDKMSKISKKLYESSVKTQNQLNELLDKCFKYNGELIDYRNFADIVEKINSDIFFMIILFLLEKRPFSFKSIQLYHNIYYNKYLSNSDISLKLSGINDNSISISKSYINRTLTSNNLSKNISSTTAYSRSYLNDNISVSLKDVINAKNKKIFQNNSSIMIQNESNLNINFDKTIFEAKLSKDITEEMDKIKNYEIKDEEKDELEEEVLESEKNNYEGYIYKFNNGKMIKIWFKLFYRDYYYYKKKDDIKHIGMHNLSGLYFIEEPPKIYEDKTFYSFSIIFPSKKHTYFSDNKIGYDNCVKYLQIATNYSNIVEKYELTEDLGSGSFSYVKLGINKYTNEKVAVKIMEKNKMSSLRLESARREIEIMKICQHPNIIHYIDSYENESNIFIYMEYCEGGTFFDFLKKRNFILKEELAVNIIYKICKAVYYFHSYGITHRDLKPENILMTSEDDNADIKILDFGLGKIIGPNEKCSEPYGTIIYCAPEIILDYPYTKNVDSWSIGVITFIILYGRLPFWDKDRSQLSMKITKINPLYKSIGNNHISDEAKNFIQNLLIKDQNKRMSIEQALHHKWFQKYNKHFLNFNS